MSTGWLYETRGEWTFRVRFTGQNRWLAQVVKGDFRSEDVLCAGNPDLWFAYGPTQEAAMAEVARDVLS